LLSEGSILSLGFELKLPSWWREAVLLAGLGLIALWGVLWFVTQRWSARAERGPGRAHQPTLTPHEQLDRSRESQGLRRDLEQVMAEIETFSQKLGEQMDRRSQRIELLLKLADERIRELQRLADEAARTSASVQQTVSSPQQQQPEAMSERSSSSLSSIASATTFSRDNALYGEPAGPSAPPTRQPPRGPSPRTAAGVQPASSMTATGVATRSSELDDPVARSIYRLADQGASAMDISRKLNEHLGKVELILALRQV
jgi:hypothetical protein